MGKKRWKKNLCLSRVTIYNENTNAPILQGPVIISQMNKLGAQTRVDSTSTWTTIPLVYKMAEQINGSLQHFLAAILSLAQCPQCSSLCAPFIHQGL